jgi:hypothetical protein
VTQLVIPPQTPLYQSLQRLVERQRIVFFAGLPGVGKSLLLQQLALLAGRAGRAIYLLQWDVSRAAFETAELLARYPEIDGVTHAAIRKGVGRWARQAVWQWHTRHPGPAPMLIGEAPLMGNRLIELVQKGEDAAEALLAGRQTRFVTPVPSGQVRQAIEAARSRTINQPQHEREQADAPPQVLQALWRELYQLAQQLGLTPPADGADPAYDPAVYATLFSRLLRHRHAETWWIESVLPASGSVYALSGVRAELVASPAEVRQIMAGLDRDYSEPRLAQIVANWYESLLLTDTL